MTKEIFIPIHAVSGRGAMRTTFKQRVRLEYLPEKKEKTELFSGDIHCDVDFHFPYNAIGDIDNLLKPTLDLLKGSVIHDDRQIKSLNATLKENSGKTGISIRLTPLTLGEAVKVDTVEVTAIVKRVRRKKRKKVSKWKSFWRKKIF